MHNNHVAAIIIASVFAWGAEARGGGHGGHGGRISYGGGHHTTSHGGHYLGGSGSSHRGGSYRNFRTGDQYAHTNNECWARQRADWVTHLTNLTGPQPAEDPAAARA